MRKPPPQIANSKGFTMVEIAIVVAIISVMVAGALTLSAPLMKGAQDSATRDKLHRVSKAISLYAVMNYRIPCPAIPDRTPTGAEPPFGYENGSSAAGTAVPDGCPATAGAAYREGIIPFNTLGLPEALAKDAWGNFFTYAVSPAFTWNTKLGTNPALVHPVCRTREWMYDSFLEEDGGELEVVLANKNPDKARFCCSADPDSGDAVNGDLVISENGVPTGLTRFAGVIVGYGNGDVNDLIDAIDQSDTFPTYPYDWTPMPPSADYAAIADDVTLTTCGAALPTDPCWGILYGSTKPPAYMTASVPAFVIVSHGANGRGAYIVDGAAAATKANTPAAGQRERENADYLAGGGNRLAYSDWYYAQGNTNDPFDDIVIWRTQEQLMAEYGQSCNVP